MHVEKVELLHESRWKQGWRDRLNLRQGTYSRSVANAHAKQGCEEIIFQK